MFHIARREDEQLRLHLLNGGWRVQTMEWSEPDADWTEFDIVLLKSPFDYHLRPEAFNHWLADLHDRRIPLINPYRLLTWNEDKHYLKDISDAGFTVIPSLFLEKDCAIDFANLFEQYATDRLIVKPCVSGGSKNTFVVTKDDPAHRTEIARLLESEAYIVQPFMENIRNGESSLVFFNGKYSHSIVKKPKEGDFRVQPQYGGTIHPHIPDPKYIREAEQILDRFARDAFYARVDGIIIDGSFVLMELELIDPILYLEYADAGYAHYLDGLKENVSKIHLNRQNR